MPPPKAKKLVFNNKRTKNAWVVVAVRTAPPSDPTSKWEYETPAGVATGPSGTSKAAGSTATTLPCLADGTPYDISPLPFYGAMVVIYADEQMTNLAGTLTCDAPEGSSANAVYVEIVPQSTNPDGTISISMVNGTTVVPIASASAPVASIAN